MAGARFAAAGSSRERHLKGECSTAVIGSCKIGQSFHLPLIWTVVRRRFVVRPQCVVRRAIRPCIRPAPNNMESIYAWIEQPQPAAEKKRRYRSKHDPALPPVGSTFVPTNSRVVPGAGLSASPESPTRKPARGAGASSAGASSSSGAWPTQGASCCARCLQQLGAPRSTLAHPCRPAPRGICSARTQLCAPVGPRSAASRLCLRAASVRSWACALTRTLWWPTRWRPSLQVRVYVCVCVCLIWLLAGADAALAPRSAAAARPGH